MLVLLIKRRMMTYGVEYIFPTWLGSYIFHPFTHFRPLESFGGYSSLNSYANIGIPLLLGKQNLRICWYMSPRDEGPLVFMEWELNPTPSWNFLLIANFKVRISLQTTSIPYACSSPGLFCPPILTMLLTNPKGTSSTNGGDWSGEPEDEALMS